MGIQVLGPLAVDGSGRLGPRDRAVLQARTVRQGGAVTADELTDAVWGDHPPPSAHKNLQSCVVRLRKALGTDAIETTADGYRLGVPAHELDSRRFEAQVARARQLLELGEADRVVYLLERALDLWRGQPFADLPDWPPARREAGRLEEVRRDAEELLLDAQLTRGGAREILPPAHEMVRTAPLRERRWELLALAQYRTGRSARPSAPSASSAPSSPASSGSTRPPRWSRSSSRSSPRIPRSDTSTAAPDRRRRPARGRGSRRTTSRSRTSSSAATRRSRQGWRFWPSIDCSPWSIRPARASPRSCGPGSALACTSGARGA